ncbi:proteinase-activated receptor 1 isoform X2 [Accipiter gentilis]|uniref:proteinase-activated receptor 1 isoform X2 n=1 Tax=Astur gentilis TaxID=8957 RepID=UPI00210FD6AC|nr:proteinase-activated receptor 1 isoform X2 [Accipiter gentilis]
MGPRALPALLCALAVLGCPRPPPAAAARVASPHNSSKPQIRSFVLSFISHQDDPIPFEGDTENDLEVGSGATNQTGSFLREQRTVSVQTARYLTSLWLTRFVPSVYTLVLVLSLPLNITAILVFLKKMKIEKPAVVYMLNLALADVLFGEKMRGVNADVYPHG